MENFKSGFVAFAGKPNVGKSTLINALMKQKIVITSNKPQTTRNKINCILTEKDYQIVFVDTPGIHKPLHKLGEYMVEIAVGALRGVDLILFVVDPTDGIRKSDMHVAEIISKSRIPTILIINKIDQIKDEKILKETEEKFKELNKIKTIYTSAIKGTNIDELEKTIVENLSKGPMYYPEDMISDKPSRFIISELIREKVFRLTEQEIPHSTGIVVEDLKTRENGMLYVRATIYVERDSQKGIIIGKSGKMIKEIGKLARLDIQEMFEEKVFLDLHVKVKKKWRESEFLIRNTMGFKDELKKDK
ncbi:GTPase Era [Tepiditoga spiralis]|uniref:GTPase Era n=1 Tax=Tepiditoga spiralis TaxID=2108365 RepID=A0A7G1G8M3_9BACT|nr:GTPase Era [Tepiditoga spiralis]BBE30392.1 GTPase Era [Tepiditoga spiralis]